ncbi:MAG: PIN domain-containing protein [Planctomycetota bacterium]|nr:PIN domain-containing protein [Planctomycetota bacterium]
MRIFFDTNILLDVLAKREPFYDESAAIWTLAERGMVVGLISAVSLTNVFYIVRKLESSVVAMKALRQMRHVFSISPCDEKVIDSALQLNTLKTLFSS